MYADNRNEEYIGRISRIFSVRSMQEVAVSLLVYLILKIGVNLPKLYPRFYPRFTQEARASKMLLKNLILTKISRFEKQHRIKKPHFITVYHLEYHAVEP